MSRMLDLDDEPARISFVHFTLPLDA